MPFAFTDAQWQPIARALERIGRKDSGGERATLDLACETFVAFRRGLGKQLPTPKGARDAWLNVAVAVERLEQSIKALRKAGAADFTVIDNHSDEIKQWAAALPWLAREARCVAEIETHGAPTVANNADPSRDAFLHQVIAIWAGYGGKIRASTSEATGKAGGPLVKFVTAVATPAFAALDEAPPTGAMIREAVRKHMVS